MISFIYSFYLYFALFYFDYFIIKNVVNNFIYKFYQINCTFYLRKKEEKYKNIVEIIKMKNY